MAVRGFVRSTSVKRSSASFLKSRRAIFQNVSAKVPAVTCSGKTTGGVCALIVSLTLFSGCNQTQRNQLQSNIEKQASDAAQSMQNAAVKTAEQTFQETVAATASGGATWRVKTALAVSSRLDGARIDVEMNGNNIILRGDVPLASQKIIAQNIAKNTLDPKFKIVNRLMVQGSQGNSRKKVSYGNSGRRTERRSAS